MRGRANFKYLRDIFKSTSVYLITRYLIIGSLTIALIKLGLGTYKDPFGNGVADSIKLAYENNMHNNELFLVAWFLIAYLFSLIICNIIISASNSLDVNKTIKKIILFSLAFLLGILSVNYVAVTYHETKIQFYNLLSQVMYGSMFMLLGYLLKGYLFRISSLSIALCIVILLAAITDTLKTTPMEMSWSQYKDGFIICTLISLMIISCIFIISNAFSEVCNKNSMMVYIGKNTKSIMTWHLCVFIMLDILMSITLKNRPLNSYAVFEHYHNEYSIAIYTFGGVMIPVLLIYLKDLLLPMIINKQKRA